MSVYYNEFEPFAAQWLRELMADGLIAQGEVDERSILDVRPADLRGYDQCHFFAGIGGWSYALRLAGWPDDRPVWTGSCPCQPLSSAGKQKGHADERHIWPAFYELIAECRPSTVFGEQVASKDGREWLAGVRADLEDARYAVGAADLCAAGVGAPHIRQRLFWVAQSPDARPPRAGGKPQPKSALIQPGNGSGKEGTASRVANAQRGASERHGHEVAGAASSHQGRKEERQRLRPDAGHGLATGSDGRLADTAGERQDGRQNARQRGAAGESKRGVRGKSERLGPDSGLADTDGRHPGAEREQRSGEQRLKPKDGGTGERVEYAASEGLPQRPGPEVHQPESQQGLERSGDDGRLGDADDTGSQGRGQHFGQHADQQPPWSASDLIPCADGKWRRVPANEAGEPEPGLFPLAHGVSNRVGTLRGSGNAITPQVAAAFIDAFASSCS
jgi:DNA (cytosine-5)-methyltransferase 1